jgi:predicted alpha-1,2-mannosidase
MNKNILIISLGLALQTAVYSQNPKQPVDYVNVFAGTSNSRWMLFPGPTMPFGMVKLSPDNQNTVWNGGYEYTVSSISGFSHLHAMSLSGVSLMPVTGKLDYYPDYLKVNPGEPDGPFGGMWTAGFRSRFNKDTEKSSPGYYSVKLLDYNIIAELTTTNRCGMLQFTYPESQDAHIIFNYGFFPEEHCEIKEAYAKKISDTEIEGYIKQSNSYINDFTVYYVIQLNKPLETIDGWTTDNKETGSLYGIDWRRPRKLQTNVNEFKEKGSCGIIMNFKTSKNEKVIVRTGISFVSLENAHQNLKSEMEPFGWDFKAVVANERKTWNDLLGNIEITDNNENNKEKFYTYLYRSYTAKSIFSDVNGQYIDMCGKVQKLPENADAVYSADGFWGGQWDLAPLWTLVTPKYASSWVNAFLELSDKGGWIPEAPTGLKYAPIMDAQHHNSLIISCYQKGIRTFDVEKAFKAIKHDLTTPGIEYPCGGYAGNRHMKAYMEYGYIPDESGPVSSTMEYAYDDWTLGQFALALNKKADYMYFNKRSQNYRNVFDPVTGYIRRKHKDGSWVEPFKPFAFGSQGWGGAGYMEGNAWIYTFFVPQDVPGLINLLGGKDKFNDRLEEGFEKGYVDLTNEPNLQAPFLFNYSEKPWLTQKYTRWVMDSLYNTSPYTGWIGEEDEGQLSSYFVMMAMGLFEMDGGCSVKPYYDISSPLFDKIVIHLDPKYYPGKYFTIKTVNNSEKNIYIQTAKLNGTALTMPILYHSDIVKGGELIIELGPEPNKKWGVKNKTY